MSPVEILQNCILEKFDEIQKLREALKILAPEKNKEMTLALGGYSSMPEGRSDPSPPAVSAPLQSIPANGGVAEEPATPAPIPRKEEYRGPRCGACNGKMYQTYRTMPSGAVVNLLKCNDSACGNEAYQ